MEESQPHIITKEDGQRRLVVGTRGYDIDPDGIVDLEGQVIPSIRMDEIPDGVYFSLYHQHFIVIGPHFFGGEGNAEIFWHPKIRDPLWEFNSAPFFKFWADESLLIARCADEEQEIPFAIVNIPGDTLDVVFEKTKKLIDEFSGQHHSGPGQLGKDGSELFGSSN